jgi:hypothetical protein
MSIPMSDRPWRGAYGARPMADHKSPGVNSIPTRRPCHGSSCSAALARASRSHAGPSQRRSCPALAGRRLSAALKTRRVSETFDKRQLAHILAVVEQASRNSKSPYFKVLQVSSLAPMPRVSAAPGRSEPLTRHVDQLPVHDHCTVSGGLTIRCGLRPASVIL